MRATISTKRIFVLFFAILMTCAACANAPEQASGHLQKLEKINYKNDFQLMNNESNEMLPEKETNNQQEMPGKRDVKGIYLNRTSMKKENIQTYIDLIKSTELNAVVMDIKDDNGKLTYDSDVDIAREIDSDSNPSVKDMEKLLARLKKEDIYTIARIVVFKDPYLAEQKTEFAINKKDGSVWEDQAGVKWIDPYKKGVWQYVTDIAKEVTDYGFDEIQYDYIRFPENAKEVDKVVAYDNKDNIKKGENIAAFLKFSNEQLKNHPVYVSADVFGLVTTAADDMGIGQKWEQISPQVDYISPMTYPSHYGPGSYGIPKPNDNPYEVVKHAMGDAVKRNKKLGDEAAVIRPWVQDFSLKRTYTEKDIRDQIRAIEEQGLHQYLIWNASNEYTKAAYQ